MYLHCPKSATLKSDEPRDVPCGDLPRSTMMQIEQTNQTHSKFAQAFRMLLVLTPRLKHWSLAPLTFGSGLNAIRFEFASVTWGDFSSDPNKHCFMSSTVKHDCSLRCLCHALIPVEHTEVSNCQAEFLVPVGPLSPGEAGTSLHRQICRIWKIAACVGPLQRTLYSTVLVDRRTLFRNLGPNQMTVATVHPSGFPRSGSGESWSVIAPEVCLTFLKLQSVLRPGYPNIVESPRGQSRAIDRVRRTICNKLWGCGCEPSRYRGSAFFTLVGDWWKIPTSVESSNHGAGMPSPCYRHRQEVPQIL